MADKHMQIWANLIKAVTNVADRGTSQESNIEGSEGSSSVCVHGKKTPSPLLNRTEQCFAAHVVHTCQLY